MFVEMQCNVCNGITVVKPDLCLQ